MVFRKSGPSPPLWMLMEFLESPSLANIVYECPFKGRLLQTDGKLVQVQLGSLEWTWFN